MAVVCGNWVAVGEPAAEEWAALELEVTITNSVVRTTTAKSMIMYAELRCTRAVYHGVDSANFIDMVRYDVLLQYNAARRKGQSLASRLNSPIPRINPAQEHS